MQDCTRADIVIFDNDGTLVPSHLFANAAIVEGFASFCRRHALRAEEPTDLHLRHLTGLPGEAFYRALLPESAKHLAAALRKHCLDHEVAAVLERAEFYPGIQEILAGLRARGARLAVATNGGQRYIEAIALRLGYRNLFDRIYHHEIEGIGDKTEMARRALRELGPGAGVFVGDRGADQDAARQLGIPFIACLYGYGSAGELAGAACRAAAPEDLHAILLGGAGPR